METLDKLKPAFAGPRCLDPYHLTPAEMRVLTLVAEGLTDKEIACALNCSRFTIAKHVVSVLQKMGLQSRTMAAVKAIREGLVP